MEDTVVPIERNLYGHSLAGLLWERQFEKTLLKHGWEKIPNWECIFVHREKGLFLSVSVDDIKLAGKKQNLDPMWKRLNKEVDLGEPTSFLDHVYLGCTPGQCEISKDTVDKYRTMFESRISAGGVEKLPFPQIFRISSWSYDVAGHAKKCVERYCELANKTTQSSIKWSMNRDEQRQVKHEKIADAAEIMNRRQQEAKEMKAQTAARTRASRDKAQVDSKDRQQFKREVKSVAHNVHLRRVKVCR